MQSLSDPRPLADPHRPDIFQVRRHFRDTQVCFARVAVRVRNPAVKGEPDIVLNDDLTVDDNRCVPPDAASVAMPRQGVLLKLCLTDPYQLLIYGQKNASKRTP